MSTNTTCTTITSTRRATSSNATHTRIVKSQ